MDPVEVNFGGKFVGTQATIGVTIRACGGSPLEVAAIDPAVLAAAADGADVTTVEGMANADGSLGTIQQAFQDNHGLQCGFCTPGMVMSAADLLQKNPNPSETEIREWLEGNLCRCTGYHNIVKSIQAAAAAGA